MVGNDAQNRYAVYAFFKYDPIIFIHQHISEDIEIHIDEEQIVLIQSKMSQTMPSLVAKHIRTYMANEDFIKFILKNKEHINKWLWVTDAESKIFKKDIFALIDAEEIFRKNKYSSLSLLQLKSFTEIMKSKFYFHNAKWIKGKQQTQNVTFPFIYKLIRSPFKKNMAERYYYEVLEYFKAQNEILLEKNKEIVPETFNTFEQLRDCFVPATKKKILKDIKNKRGKKILYAREYDILLREYDILKTKMIIWDADKEYAKKFAKIAGIEERELLGLREEMYGNK